MTKIFEKYDLILQNTGSKQEYVIRGLCDISQNPLYHEFEDFKMPEGAMEGEYMYVLILNILDGVEYVLQDDLMATIVNYEDFSTTLSNIQHEVGVMKYGKISQQNKYMPKNKNFIYRKK